MGERTFGKMLRRGCAFAWAFVAFFIFTYSSIATGEGIVTATPEQSLQLESSESTPQKQYVAIHLGGVCSTSWEVGKNSAKLGNFENVESVSAVVNQTNNMEQATADLKKVLDDNCVGNRWCYILAYSNGGATLSRVLSLFENTWNIVWVFASASNEGGSEIGGTGWAGSAFGGCHLAGHIGTTDHRAGWNHNDTGGVSTYNIAGHDCLFPYVQCAILRGEDDGAVAFHSAGGYNETFKTSTLCGDESSYYANHSPAFTCEGYDLTHPEMKMKGICLLGGCN